METDYCGSKDSLDYTKANYDEKNKALFANSCAGWEELMACWQGHGCFLDVFLMNIDIDNLGFTWFIDYVDVLKIPEVMRLNKKR
ncbi:hypothetical protein PoB_006871300 [Plakobranchus ocellatus]|uniref:Uncharacterized protein n=1 Tax=Plakobranchus ocellatus TaxID=259542 RepID=A0AAV4DDA3_9GAST|nr:hypothetical protein PoB_006871300 [Plakobranchus ocellatus]